MKQTIAFVVLMALLITSLVVPIPGVDEPVAYAATTAELIIAEDSANPESSVILAPETSTLTDVTFLLFTMTARNDAVTVSEWYVPFFIDAKDTDITLADVVSDVTVEIDGVEYASSEITSSYGSLGEVTGYATFTFGDTFVIPADESANVKVFFDLAPAGVNEANYPNGTSIQAGLSIFDVDEIIAFDSIGEKLQGLQGISLPSNLIGSTPSHPHYLYAEGIFAEIVSTDADTNGPQGEFEIKFDVTAFGDDMFINEDDLFFDIEKSLGGSTEGTVSYQMVSTADMTSPGIYRVDEGTTETFTFSVTYQPNNDGFYRMVLHTIGYDADGTGNQHAYVVVPKFDFETDFVEILTPTTLPTPLHASTTVTVSGVDVEVTSSIVNALSSDPFILYYEIRDVTDNNLVHYDVVQSSDTSPYTIMWEARQPGDYRVDLGLFSTDWSTMHEWSNGIATFNVSDQTPPQVLPPSPTLDAASIISATNQVGSPVALNTRITDSNSSDESYIVYAEIYNAADNSFVDHIVIDDFSTTNGNQELLNMYWTPTEAGDYYFSVAFFTSDWSELYAWNHRVADVTVTSVSTPLPFALTYADVTAPTTLATGEAGGITVSIENAGDAGVGHVYAVVYDDAINVVHEEWFLDEAFSVSETRSFTTTWQTTSEQGTYYIDFGMFAEDWSEMYEWKWRAADVTVQ